MRRLHEDVDFQINKLNYYIVSSIVTRHPMVVEYPAAQKSAALLSLFVLGLGGYSICALLIRYCVGYVQEWRKEHGETLLTFHLSSLDVVCVIQREVSKRVHKKSGDNRSPEEWVYVTTLNRRSQSAFHFGAPVVFLSCVMLLK
jgi:hypothetical protein